MMKHPSIGRLICACVLAAGAGAADAQNQGGVGQTAARNVFTLSNTQAALQAPGYVDLLAGVTYTNNAFLTRSDVTADEIGYAGLDIDYIHLGSELTVDALGNVARLEYFKGSFPGTFYGEFVGSALWGKRTDIFQFLVSDAFGEGMINPLLAPTPTNLQWVNYVRTGPYLNFPLGSDNHLSFFGLYARTIYQLSPFDSQSFEGGTSFDHALSSVSSLSAQVFDIHTEYLQPAVVESYPGAAHGYDTRAATGGYRGELGRTQLTMYAGYNTVNYGGEVRGAPLALLQFRRQITPFSSVFLLGETGYSTLGQSLESPTSEIGLSGGQPPLETGTGAYGNTVSPEPSQNSAGTLGWTFDRARTSFTVIGTVRDQRFVEQSSLDQTSESISANLRRQLSRAFFVSLSGTETYGHFGQLGADDRTGTVNLQLSRQFRKAVVSAYAQWIHQETESRTPNPALAAFNDERVGIGFTYDLIGHRQLGRAL